MENEYIALYLMFGIIGLTILLPLLAAVIAVVISTWKIFRKAGEKGWKSLIPFYDSLTLFRITGKPVWWIVPIVVVPVCALAVFIYWAVLNFDTFRNTGLMDIPPQIWITGGSLLGVLGISLIAAIVFYAFTMIALSRCFSAPRYFPLGLIFLSEIFLPILAFGKYKYTAPDSIPIPCLKKPVIYPQ